MMEKFETLKTIFGWFSAGKTPTADQFKDTFKSFWHKSEKLPLTQLIGLNDVLDNIVGGMINKGKLDDVSDLDAVSNPQRGWSYIIVNEKAENGRSYIYQFDGERWNNSGLTNFPGDVVIDEDLKAYATNESVATLKGEVADADDLLSGRIDNVASDAYILREDMTTAGHLITSLEGRVSEVETSKADKSEVQILSENQSAAGFLIKNLTGRMTDVEENKAEKSEVNDLSFTVSTVGQKVYDFAPFMIEEEILTYPIGSADSEKALLHIKGNYRDRFNTHLERLEALSLAISNKTTIVVGTGSKSSITVEKAYSDLIEGVPSTPDTVHLILIVTDVEQGDRQKLDFYAVSTGKDTWKYGFERTKIGTIIKDLGTIEIESFDLATTRGVYSYNRSFSKLGTIRNYTGTLFVDTFSQTRPPIAPSVYQKRIEEGHILYRTGTVTDGSLEDVRSISWRDWEEKLTTDYTSLVNKPQINSIELDDNKTPEELGLSSVQDSFHYLKAISINFLDGLLGDEYQQYKLQFKQGTHPGYSTGHLFVNQIVSTTGEKTVYQTLLREGEFAVRSGQIKSGETEVAKWGEWKSLTDYNSLSEKPSINGVGLEGNKTSDDLKLLQTHVVDIDFQKLKGLTENSTSAELYAAFKCSNKDEFTVVMISALSAAVSNHERIILFHSETDDYLVEFPVFAHALKHGNYTITYSYEDVMNCVLELGAGDNNNYIVASVKNGSDVMKYKQLASVDEYEDLAVKDSTTMYVIIEEDSIVQAFLGEYPFATGGGGSDTILIDTILLSAYNVTLDDSPVKIDVTLSPDNATSKTLKWTSSNNSVAQVNSSGVITPIGNGQCTVTVEAVRGGASADVAVTVSISPKSVKITNSDNTLEEGVPYQLNATVSPANAENKTLRYESDNMNVATVNASGVVGHVADGNVTITVKTRNDLSDSITLHAVTPVRGIEMTGKVSSIDIGETHRMGKVFTPSNPTNKNVLWATSDVNIAQVDQNGDVTGVNKGNALITLTTEDGSFSDENALRVILPVSNLAIEGSSKVVYGYELQLGYIPTPADADIDVLEWSVSNTSLATISNTGLLTPKVDEGSFTVTIKEAKHNISATLNVTISPLGVGKVVCEEGNTVNSIFTHWNTEIMGNATKLEYTEYAENGAVLQTKEVDLDSLNDGKLPIELYAEFGTKNIDFKISNPNGDTDVVRKTVTYVEPELVHYEFDVDVKCTQEQAAGMSMKIPYYKYDKKFAYCLRNDDNGSALWRMIQRYCNRLWDMRKITMGLNDMNVPYPELKSKGTSKLWRFPRRLGYTDGCGLLKTFCFDTGGVVIWNTGQFSWDMVAGNNNNVYRADILQAKDYGGHFLIHNMVINPPDWEVHEPNYVNDFTYELQRCRDEIQKQFGYTSVTFANPDGEPFYTQPCIKDPKTLLLSGGGQSFDDPASFASHPVYSTYGPDTYLNYGLPPHRARYAYDSDLLDVPLSEIRNTLMLGYTFNDQNRPRRTMNWVKQYNLAVGGKPSFDADVTHGFHGSLDGTWDPSYEPDLENIVKDLAFFDEMYRIVGAGGNDWVWFCSCDEVIEYMYYQRVAKVTKTLTDTGCRFKIAFDIPDYLSFKTYSASISGLPEAAVVSYASETPVTYFNKNMKSGILNFGFSEDITERANRYVDAYLADPTSDNLDLAWYFVRQLGETSAYTTLAAKIPALDELPHIDHIDVPATPETDMIDLTIRNTNRKFGEADYLEISRNADMSEPRKYYIEHTYMKHYPIQDDDAGTLNNTFSIKLDTLFNEDITYYCRYTNFTGSSSVVPFTTRLSRVQGTNDPGLSIDIPEFTENATLELHPACTYLSQVRYKIGDKEYTDWMAVSEKLSVAGLELGDNVVIIEGRNNLNEVVSVTKTVNYFNAEFVVKTYTSTDGKNPASLGYNSETGFTHMGWWDNQANAWGVFDVNGVQRCTAATQPTITNIDGLFQPGVKNVLISTPVNEGEENKAIYPDSMIEWYVGGGRVIGGALPNQESARASYTFFGLPAGKYLVKLFGRHLRTSQVGTATAFVKTKTLKGATTAEFYNYDVTSKTFDVTRFYDNNSYQVAFSFTADGTTAYDIGVDSRVDIYGVEGSDRQYGFSVVELIKIQE